MPQKRDEVIEKVDAGEMMPDIYEKWLKKQPATEVRAKAGYVGAQVAKVVEEDRAETRVEKAEDSHEKAKRRKRSVASR